MKYKSILIAIIICFLFSCQSTNYVNKKGGSPEWPMDFRELKKQKVAYAVEDEIIKENNQSIVFLLNDESKNISVGNRAYLYRRNGSDIRLLFISWINKKGFGGYLYCTTPLEDLSHDKSKTIKITGPTSVKNNKSSTCFVTTNYRFEPHWHSVVYSFPKDH